MQKPQMPSKEYFTRQLIFAKRDDCLQIEEKYRAMTYSIGKQ